MQTFTHVGVSRRHGGPFKARFANGLDRVKTLVATGHTEIELLEAPEPMEREGLVNWLLTQDFHKDNEEIQAALTEASTKLAPVVKEPKKRGRPRKVVEAIVPADQVIETELGTLTLTGLMNANEVRAAEIATMVATQVVTAAIAAQEAAKVAKAKPGPKAVAKPAVAQAA